MQPFLSTTLVRGFLSKVIVGCTNTAAGPSILVHVVKSPQGGVFSMFVDDFLIEDPIDTFNADGELCYPLQFPPFAAPPPGYGERDNHSITLVHIGPSKKAPNGTTSSTVVFDAFAIPQVEASVLTSNAITNAFAGQTVMLSLILQSVAFLSFSVWSRLLDSFWGSELFAVLSLNSSFNFARLHLVRQVQPNHGTQHLELSFLLVWFILCTLYLFPPPMKKNSESWLVSWIVIH